MKNLTRFLAAAALGAALLVLPGIASAQILAGQNEPVYKNLLDNGAFNISQRGTTTISSITTTATYLHDRWAATAGTSTSSSIANSTGSPTLPTGFSNAALVQRTAAQTGLVNVCLVQEIPGSDIIPLQGQPVTLSFYLAAGANLSSASGAVVAQVTTGTGADEGLATWITGLTGAASAIPTANKTVTPTTGYQRFAVTGTIPTTATEAVVNICFTPVGTAGTTDGIFVTGVQLERGTVATNFESRSVQMELAKAQRYFWQISDPAATVVIPSACFVTAANTTVKCGVFLPQQMRVAPATTVTSVAFGIVVTAGTAGTCTAIAATASSNTVNAIGLTCTTGGTIALGSATPLIGAAVASATLKASADF